MNKKKQICRGLENEFDWLILLICSNQVDKQTESNRKTAGRKEDVAARTSKTRRKAGDFAAAVIIGLNYIKENKSCASF
jgi:hypothetical protein